MERTISFMNGEGSIGHNTRSFIAANVDKSRTENNITLINEDIKQVYCKLFDKSLAEYNAKQKRKDRQIKNYYEKIKRSRQEKLAVKVDRQQNQISRLTDKDMEQNDLNGQKWKLEKQLLDNYVY